MNVPELFVAGQYAEWVIHYRWCSTGILWGYVYGYSHYHTLTGLSSLSLTKDDGIIENTNSSFTYLGRVNGGHRGHIKGRLESCFFGVCAYTTPWINIWVHMDGSFHTSQGGV